MLDRKFIGWMTPAHTVIVEKGRVRFFAKAIGETNPIYSDEDAAKAAGFRSIVIPPTFISCLESERPTGGPNLLQEMGIHISRILHGEQHFTYHAPVCVGDCITFQGKVTDIYEKKGGTLGFIVRETTATNQDGVLAATIKSITVVR